MVARSPAPPDSEDPPGRRVRSLRGLLLRLKTPLKIMVLVGIGLAVAWLRVWSPVPVHSAQVERHDLVETAFGRGTIESQREAAVGFDLVGRLSAVLVEEGARVSLGQELAQLETDQVQAELKSAETGVAAARSSLRRLAAEEKRVRSLLEAAERDATRMEALFKTEAVAEQQRDDVADRVRLARADLDRVLAQRAEATRGIDVAAGGAEQRRVALVRATLLAPFDGVVTRRFREPGDTATIGTTVLRIADTDAVHVSAALDETVLPRLAVDQPATIQFPGNTAPVVGRVSKVGWEADRQTHEIQVEIVPEQGSGLGRRVAIGQRADVRVELGRRAQALAIPVGMIHHDVEGPHVFASRNGRITRVRPRFGVTGDGFVEVIEGLALGDVVLAAAQPKAVLPEGRRWVAK